MMLQNFTATSFDDNILEVVAVFGSVQLGISRVINLQRHRIAQVHKILHVCCYVLHDAVIFSHWAFCADNFMRDIQNVQEIYSNLKQILGILTYA